MLQSFLAEVISMNHITNQTADGLAVAIATSITERETDNKVALVTLATDRHWWSPKLYASWSYSVAPDANMYDPSIDATAIGQALKKLGFHYIMSGDQSGFGYVCRANIWYIPFYNSEVIVADDNPSTYYFHEVA